MTLAHARTENAPLGWSPSTSDMEFETLLELGRGGMATAYLARSRGAGGFERLVVLKRLSQELAGNRQALSRFLAEARVAATLHHVNVVGTHQIGSDALGPFMVLDYVEGGSLDDLIGACRERDEWLPVGVVLRIALDVLAGLAAVHEATDGTGRPLDILHRDVSVENVLVGVHDGVARLSDFGVARSVLGRGFTEPGCFVGKLPYFPPEYLLREPTGPPLDIYALGVALFIALTGDDLWPDASDGELIRAIIEEGVPPLAERREVMPEVASLVARACARDWRDRFQSAREMADAIEGLSRQGLVSSHGAVASAVERLLGEKLRQRRDALARSAPAVAPRTAPAKPRLARLARMARRMIVIPIAIAALGAGLLVWFSTHSSARAPNASHTEPTAVASPHVVSQTGLEAARPQLSTPALAATRVSPEPPGSTTAAPHTDPTPAPSGHRARVPRRASPPTATPASQPEASAGGIERKNPYRAPP